MSPLHNASRSFYCSCSPILKFVVVVRFRQIVHLREGPLEHQQTSVLSVGNWHFLNLDLDLRCGLAVFAMGSWTEIRCLQKEVDHLVSCRCVGDGSNRRLCA